MALPRDPLLFMAQKSSTNSTTLEENAVCSNFSATLPVQEKNITYSSISTKQKHYEPELQKNERGGL